MERKFEHMRWMAVLVLGAIIVGAMATFTVGASDAEGRLPVLVFGVAVQVVVSVGMVVLQRPWWLACCWGFSGAAVLVSLPEPWPMLVRLGAVPWVPVVVAWSAVLAVLGSRTLRQAAGPAAAAVAFVVAAAVSATANPVLMAAGVSAPIFGGATVGLWVRLRATERERAATQLRQLRLEHQQALLSEREAIATRLHDDLGHVLTLVLLHSRSAAARSMEPTGDLLAHQVSALANQGLAIMRETVSSTLQPTAPPPASVADEDWITAATEIVEQARSGGQDVRLVLTVAPHAIPAAVARAAHRAVKEGLTNVRRHAFDAPATVAVRQLEGYVEVKVSNEAPTTDDGPTRAAAPGNGLGLRALSQGVLMLGGTLQHAPTASGGYELIVHLPTETVVT